MFISASEALQSDSIESNISSSKFEAMPALLNSGHIGGFMVNSKLSAESNSTPSLCSSMSLGTGPLWWS